MAAHRVGEALGLLEDFLQHEVGIAAPLDGGQIPLDLVDRLVHVSLDQVPDPVAAPGQHRHFTVVEIHYAPGVLQYGGSIGGNEVFPLSHAHQQGRTLAGRHQQVGLLGGDHHDSVGPGHVPEGLGNRFFEVPFVVGPDQVGQHLGIGFGFELVAPVQKRLAESPGILDDPVVNHGNAPALVQVGMSVRSGGRAVSGPPGVAHSQGTRSRVALYVLHQDRKLAGGLLDLDAATVDNRHAGRVVTPVLHAPQPLQQNWGGLLGADVAYDSTHRISRSPSGVSRDTPRSATGPMPRSGPPQSVG